MNDLSAYHNKRDPAATQEPFTATRATGGAVFVVHKHSARQLHYDLRLEVAGSLWSWAVPRGPSPDPADKRLAVHVEPHPVDYAFWEGTIPEGNYGAGAMIIWDRGQWLPLEDPVEGLKKGKLLFELRGFKLFGTWTLVQTKRANGKDWLLIKEQDGWVGRIPEPPADSVVSGLTVEQLKAGEQPAIELEQELKRAGLPALQAQPKAIKPMLCEAGKPFDRKGWFFEIKYDGYRVLAEKFSGGVRLRSRNGNDLTGNFPEIRESVEALPYDNLILDGEIVCLGPDGLPSFQRLQQRAQLKRAMDVQRASITLAASYFAFDTLAVANLDLRKRPLEERKDILKGMLPSVSVLRFVDHFPAQGRRLYEHAVAMRLEGLVAKKANSSYAAGRSKNWVKIAALRTDDFVVAGYLPPKPSDRSFKALLLAQYDASQNLVYLGRAGSGLDGTVRARIEDNFARLERPEPEAVGTDEVPKDAVWLNPELVVEARYKNVTKAGNLRQPVLLRLRDDKAAADCALRDVEHALATPVEVESSRPRDRVILSNQAKMFWPAGGRLKKPVTKGDLIKHYEQVSDWLLPWLKDRPVVLTRYPDGIDGKSFFQHQAPAFLPSWIRTERITKSDGDEIDYIILDDLDSLRYIINLGTIPLHIWSACVTTLDYPDYCILDLDPKGAPMAHMANIARTIERICQRAALPTVIKTSGGSGLHLLIPLGGQLSHEQATSLGELLARIVAKKLPDIATIQRAIELREGRVYLDYLQNGFGKTIAAPFCARPHPGAPVSMPLRWTEVKNNLDPQRFNVTNAAQRLRKLNADLCQAALGEQVPLQNALQLLAKELA